jgi:hypothetical protein
MADQQTTRTPDFDTEREELMQATQHLVRSLFRTGVQLALVPVNMLPPEPRQHFKTAGREFTRGFATLVRGIADDVERVVEETKEEVERE